MADDQNPNQTQAPLNVDEETFFNKYQPNVTEEEFFNKYSPGGLQQTQQSLFDKGPYQGSMSDYFFGQTHVGKILSAFGEGAKEGWGTDNNMLSKEFKWEAEHKEEDKGILYGLHTAIMRPLASAIDTVTKGSFAAIGGTLGALGQAGENASEYNKKDPYSLPGILGGPLGELAKNAASGALPDFGAPHIPQYAELAQEARMKAIIGEGEPGFYRTKKPTSEQMEARNQAAADAGYGPETAQQWLDTGKTVPTPRELASQIDPDLFKEVDHLNDLHENLQLSIQQELTKARDETERLKEDQGTDEIKPSPVLKKILSGVQDLQERAQETDTNIRDTLEKQKETENRAVSLLESQSPEGDAFRNLAQVQALERAIQIENIRPQVQKAYRDASELLPVEEEVTKSMVSAETGKKNPLSVSTKTPAQKILESDGPPRVRYKGNMETGTANKLENEAVEKGVADYFGDKATFESMRDQIPKAIDFVDSNYDQAKKIVSGKIPAPEGIHPVAIFNALKQEAYRRAEEGETSDVNFLPELARSPYNRVVSEAGQTLGMVRGMFDNLDPSDIMKNVEDAWTTKMEKKVNKTVDDIKKYQQDAIKKFKPDYEAFLKSIECE